MRPMLIALPVLLLAAPAAAQPANDLTRELTDPRTADRLGKMVGALSRALLDLNVGEIEAAVESRPVTDADRRRTVRDMAGGDRNLDRQIEQQAASGMRAMAAAVPAIINSVDRAAAELDRAVANLPTPGYPRR